jgi:hypothetical protein
MLHIHSHCLQSDAIFHCKSLNLHHTEEGLHISQA